MIRHAIVMISIISAAMSAAADPIGARAKGGYPEYLFLEKAPRSRRRPPRRSWRAP